MPDTLTDVWGFVKQVIGGNRNTWGGILNANFDTVEAGLAGILSKAVIGGSVTLTDEERRNRVLIFSGALGSNQIVVVDNLPGVWLVKNGTSGAYSTTMKTSSGTAVEVPQGGWATVWCDGNDVVSVGPSTLLFTSLMKVADGGYSFTNDTDCALYRIGANNLGIKVNDTKILDILTTGLGITGDLAISGNLGVTADTDLVGDLLVESDLTVNGTTTLHDALTAEDATFNDVVTQASTSHGVAPGGTTAQRPGVPASKYWRINEDTGQIEYYWNSAWRSVDINKTPRGYRFGGTLKNNSVSANTDIDIDVGVFRSSDDTATLIGTAMTKRLSSSWAAGTGNGMRSSASLANGTWHIFIIGKTDGTTDYFAHTSADPSAVLPTGYTLYRRIGSILREGSAIASFVQNGNYFRRKDRIRDYNDTNPGTTAVSVTLSVPLGIEVMAHCSGRWFPGSGAAFVLVSALDETNATPSVSAFTFSAGTLSEGAAEFRCKTNTSGQVRSRASASGSADVISIVTHGWVDFFTD